jgi:hypothetical protein
LSSHALLGVSFNACRKMNEGEFLIESSDLQMIPAEEEVRSCEARKIYGAYDRATIA